MPQDDLGELARRREALEARVREAEEKRDRLLEQLAAGPIERPEPGEEPSRDAQHARLLDQIENVLRVVQPSVGMVSDMRDCLIDEKAALADDIKMAAEATEMLQELSTGLVELTTTIDQLQNLAANIRASTKFDA